MKNSQKCQMIIILLKTLKIPWDFMIQTDPPILDRRTNLLFINKKKKKRTCYLVNFTILTDCWVKMKEMEKIGKYKDLIIQLKKLWNMKITVIPIIVGALGTVPKGLEKGLKELELRERIETIQPTAALRSARILKRFLETWGDLLSLSLQRKASISNWC